MPRTRAALAVALGLILYGAPARAGAGFGELCEAQIPVAHGFYWSDTLRRLVGPSPDVSVNDVSEVAWDDRYIFAKTEGDGPWYIIDTSLAGDSVIESFPAASPSWAQRLAELGRTTPAWRYPSGLPRPLNLGCIVRALPLLLIVVLVNPPYLVLVLIVGTVAITAFRRARRRPRPG